MDEHACTCTYTSTPGCKFATGDLPRLLLSVWCASLSVWYASTAHFLERHVMSGVMEYLDSENVAAASKALLVGQRPER